MTFPHMIDGVPHVLCQGCEALVPCRTQEKAEYPDEGLIITLKGWYGAFTDTLPGDEPESLMLCHDCAQAIYDTIPALAKQRGLHSTHANERCCNYWWTFGHDETGTIDSVVYGDGTFRPLNRDGTTPAQGQQEI